MCQFRRHYAEQQLGLPQSESSLINFTGPGAVKNYPPDLQLEPLHLKIALALDLATETAEGTVTTSVVANNKGAYKLELDAIDFEIAAVTAIGSKEGGDLTYSYDGNKIKILWDKPFALGEKRDVAVKYKVTKPISGLFFSKPSKEYPKKALYVASDHETERARYWLPCIDLPNVRTTLEFELTAEAKLEILANGKFVKEVKNSNGTKTVHWSLEQRCPSYLVCFTIGEFVSYDDGEFEGIPVKFYASASAFKSEDLKRAFGRTRDMLAWMTKKLDMKFPFPKYYQFALPNFGGAMENISLVSWDDWFVLDEKSAGERSWITDQVNVHEMAHSYFGDTVVIREFAHAWLKESWATYMEQCWLEDSKGEDEWMGDFYRNSLAYFSEFEEVYARPLVTREYKSSWQMYDRHLYPGGACRLHTLRKYIGDDVFWRAVQDYLKTFAGKVVETEDFRKMLEKHSGRSLVKQFEQWVYTAAFPDLKISFEWSKEKKTGTFTVEQKQADATKGIPVFEFNTEIGWTVGSKSFTAPAEVMSKTQQFSVSMDVEPDQVRFNPGATVLCRIEFNPGDDKLKKQLTGSKDIIGRILAAVELAKSGKRTGLQAIVDAYGKEKFWVVRREFLKAISKFGTDDAIAALADLIKSENDPLVMDIAFALGRSYTDKRLADALSSRAADKIPPMCKHHLYESIGAQKDQVSFDVLKKGASEVDAHGLIRMGALRAMGASRHEGALDELLKASVYGAPSERTRGAAAAGLGKLAPVLKKGDREKAVARIREMLRDPQDFVRWTAGTSLQLAEAYEAVGDLESFRMTVPLQQQVGVEKIIAALSKGAEPKVASLEKQLEEITDKWRKLDVRLQNIENKSDVKAKVAKDTKTGMKPASKGSKPAKSSSRKLDSKMSAMPGKVRKR